MPPRPRADQDDRVWSAVLAFDRRHPELADLGLVAVLAAASAPWVSFHAGRHAGTVWWIDAGLLIPLILRRRLPEAVFLVLCGVALVQWLISIPMPTDVTLLGAIYTVASERPRPVAIAATVIAEAGVVMASIRWGLGGSWERSLVGLSGLVAVAALLGTGVSSRRAHLAELLDRAARLEVERDQKAMIAAAAERARMAREMHDVIAHSLAVIVSLADGAQAKLAREPERAGEAIANVANVGRQALGETRRLLGVLRESELETSRAPQPGLGQLPALLEQVRSTGLQATLRFDGEPFEVPPGAELTVYRIVQEAATNTLKHASGAARFDVVVSYNRPSLCVEVVDDGTSTRPPAGGGGGIRGMRERLALYGGSLSAGRGPAGGWAVQAVLRADPQA
jgi:signal transduction histidine kinase